MSHQLTDKLLLDELLKNYSSLGYSECSEALADTFREKLKVIQENAAKANGTFSLFLYAAEASKSKELPTLYNIWTGALQLSLFVLKRHDLRENPSGNGNLTAPLIDEISSYYAEAAKFEPILFASDPWYRDHFAHVLRVWLLGLHTIFRNGKASAPLPPTVTHDPEINKRLFKSEELYSIFSIAALAHDLGYPIEKVAKLNNVVANILESFGGVNWQQIKIAFSQPRHQIAQEVLKVISSKPHFRLDDNSGGSQAGIAARVEAVLDSYTKGVGKGRYIETICNDHGLHAVFRCQWKYHQKFSTSLEKNDHGLLSALLLQRKLVFFKEGEFAIEEDYKFNLEEVRQFLIRREILRAIATHTCQEVYFMNPLSVDALLFFCDEIQEWGRPAFANMYNCSLNDEPTKVFLDRFDTRDVHWRVETSGLRPDSVAYWLLSVGRNLYARFRSAPDTELRKLSVQWTLRWKWDKIECEGVFNVGPNAASQEVMSFQLTKDDRTADILDLVREVFQGREFDEARRSLIVRMNKFLTP